MSAAALERRRGGRDAPERSGWREGALLRPGLAVRIVNLGPYGALVECPTRLRPGRRAELQLVSETDRKHIVPGRIERCQVVALSPLSFRGAIAFDSALRAESVG